MDPSLSIFMTDVFKTWIIINIPHSSHEVLSISRRFWVNVHFRILVPPISQADSTGLFANKVREEVTIAVVISLSPPFTEVLVVSIVKANEQVHEDDE